MNIQSFTKHFALTLVALCMAAFVHGQSIDLISPNPIDGTVNNTVTLNLSGFGLNTPTFAGVIIPPSTYNTFPISSPSPTSVTFSIPANALAAGNYDVFVFSFGTGFVQTTGTPLGVGPTPPPLFNPGSITLSGSPGVNLNGFLTLTTANPEIDGNVSVIIQRSSPVTGFGPTQSTPILAVVTPTFTSNSVTFQIPDDLRHVGATNGTPATYTFFLQKVGAIVPGPSVSYTVAPTTAPTITSFSPTLVVPGSTVTITGTYLCQGTSPTPPPVVDIYSWDGVSLPALPIASPIATVTKANGKEATFTVPTIPAGTYRIRYRYNGTIASFVPFTVLTVSSSLPPCTPAPTLSFTPPSNIYLGSVISGTATNATSVTATVGGLPLVNTGTATSFSFTITNQVYNPLVSGTVTATRAISGCSANSSFSGFGPVLSSSFGTPSAIALQVGVGGSVSVPGNGLLGSFSLVPSTVANPAVDVSQDIPITATAPGGTTPAVLNIPNTVPAGSYRVRLINALHPSPGIITSSAFITIVAFVPPTITSVSPSSITSTTGTLTITGNNFLGATAVAFGTTSIPYVNASSFTVVNNTTITVPFSDIPSFNGARNVRVTTPLGTSAPSTVTVSRPTLTLTSFSPSFAAKNSSPTTNNGTIITISGSGLSGLNTSYVVEFQTSTSGSWTPGVPGILSAGVPSPTLSVNAAGTIVYIRAPHNAVTGRIRLRSLIGGVNVVSNTNINLIGTTPATWLSSAEEENNGGETDNVQIIGGADSSSATLFPNPTSDAVSVTTQGFTGEVTISLMDMMGATIETKAVSAGAEAQFNLANRQRGVYVIRLTDEAGHTELRRVVKE